MTELVIGLLPLISLIFQEFFSAQARAREEDKKFSLDQANLKLMVNEAMKKWITQSAQDSKDAGNAWDQADKNRN